MWPPRVRDTCHVTQFRDTSHCRDSAAAAQYRTIENISVNRYSVMFPFTDCGDPALTPVLRYNLIQTLYVKLDIGCCRARPRDSAADGPRRGGEGASSLATVATIACPHCCCLLIQKNYKGSQATMKSEIITPSVHNSTPPWEWAQTANHGEHMSWGFLLVQRLFSQTLVLAL